MPIAENAVTLHHSSLPLAAIPFDPHMQEKIIILDFGSQTTQLIGRRVRELSTYCEIVPYNKFPYDDESVIGVILSGSPFSVYDEKAFKTELNRLRSHYPVLGICYGAQLSTPAALSNPLRRANTDVRSCRRSITKTPCLTTSKLAPKCG